MNLSFHFKNLGAISDAKLDLGDLTIICGENNTGKTYMTHAVYGFLDYWRRRDRDRVPTKMTMELAGRLIKEGSATVPFNGKILSDALNAASKRFSREIEDVFTGNAKLFQDTEIAVAAIGDNDLWEAIENMRLVSPGRSTLEMKKDGAKKNIQLSFLVNERIPGPVRRFAVGRMLDDVFREGVLKDQLPKPFIASTERTGSATFHRDLDFHRNRKLDDLLIKEGKPGRERSAARRSATKYPIPVRDNVDFIRGIPDIVGEDGEFAKKNPDVLDLFKKISGGEYKIARDKEIQYTPTNKRNVRLVMAESSSSVRSLLDIGFYLRHIARSGDLLIIDEPELNLHPKNQRLVARLFAMLVNRGIKVFITTHSDYITRELNILIMLKARGERSLRIIKENEYDPGQLLSHDKLKVYVAKKTLFQLKGNKKRTWNQSLERVEVNEEGIAPHSFDDTIEDMNRIQDEIVWRD